MFQIEVTEIPARRLFARQHRGAYNERGRAFEALGPVIAANDLWSQALGMVGVYHDSPDQVAEPDLRSHAGGWMMDAALVPDGLEEVRLSGGPAAVLHFRGPCSGLEAAWDDLCGRWLPQSGRHPSGAKSYKLYLNSPMDTAPVDLLTDICLPLA